MQVTQDNQGQELHLFARQLPRLGLRPYVKRHLCACGKSETPSTVNPKILNPKSEILHGIKRCASFTFSVPCCFFLDKREHTRAGGGGLRHAADARSMRPQTRARAHTPTLWYSETRMSESLRSVRRSAAACTLGSRTECREPDADPSLQRVRVLAPQAKNERRMRALRHLGPVPHPRGTQGRGLGHAPDVHAFQHLHLLLPTPHFACVRWHHSTVAHFLSRPKPEL